MHRETSRTQGTLTLRSEYDRLGRLRRRDTFNGNSQRPAPRRWSRRWDYDYANNLIREERDDNPFHWHRWQYDSAGRLLAQDGTLPGQEQWRWDAAGNPLEETDSLAVRHNRVTQLNGIRWRYDIHGRTIEKDNGQTRWHYRYDGEHRLTDVISQPRERNKPQVQVSFRYDPLGRRISKTRSQTLNGQPQGRRVTTRFVWERFRLLQEIQDEVPLTYVYSDEGSYDPLARIDGSENPEIYWFHNQPNGTPERLTDAEGQLRWEGQNSAWGKLLRESSLQGLGFAQNLRMQGQYLDRETGLHYNLFRYYDPDCGRFTQPDPIGLAGGLNLYQYAPNPLGWIDPLGLTNKCMGVSESGHHVPAVRKSKGRPFEVSRSDKTRPTLFPRGKNPEHDHWRLHDAERDVIGPRQGDFPGSDKELFDAYRKAYSKLDDIRVDVKSPNGTHTLGTNVTPSKAVDLIEIWLKGQGLM